MKNLAPEAEKIWDAERVRYLIRVGVERGRLARGAERRKHRARPRAGDRKALTQRRSAREARGEHCEVGVGRGDCRSEMGTVMRRIGHQRVRQGGENITDNIDLNGSCSGLITLIDY